jgi:16S rRNA (guanine527-N7)-methyltransferase
MDGATKERLRQGALALGVPLDEDQVKRFARYLDLLLLWNRKINLTAIDDPAGVVDRHFLDSLAIVPLVRSAKTLVDVGSGAGFPGVVLSVACPGLQVTCVESIRKKVAFIQTLKGELAPQVTPVCARMEELLAAGRQFDVAVSRATFEPAEWVARGAPLVAPGGQLVAMQTHDSQELHSPEGFAALPPRTYTIASVSRRLQAFLRAPS